MTQCRYHIQCIEHSEQTSDTGNLRIHAWTCGQMPSVPANRTIEFQLRPSMFRYDDNKMTRCPGSKCASYKTAEVKMVFCRITLWADIRHFRSCWTRSTVSSLNAVLKRDQSSTKRSANVLHHCFLSTSGSSALSISTLFFPSSDLPETSAAFILYVLGKINACGLFQQLIETNSFVAKLRSNHSYAFWESQCR